MLLLEYDGTGGGLLSYGLGGGGNGLALDGKGATGGLSLKLSGLLNRRSGGGCARLPTPLVDLTGGGGPLGIGRLQGALTLLADARPGLLSRMACLPLPL